MQEYEQPPKSSGCAKVILWSLAIIGGLFVLLCAGGIFVGYQFFKKSIIQEPAEVRQFAQEITDIELPDSYPPAFAMRVPFVGMKMVVFGDREGQQGGPVLMFMEFPAQMGGDRDEMKVQMQQNLRQQGGRQGNVKIEETEQRTYMVRGEEQTAVISRGVDEDGTAVVQVWVAFSAKSGNTAMLMLVTPEGQWDEVEFEAILKSMDGAAAPEGEQEPAKAEAVKEAEPG